MTEMAGDYEAVYMRKDCHWYLSNYPNPPAGYGENTIKALQEAGLIGEDLKLTLLGYEVRKLYRDAGMETINFWTLPQVLNPWPVTILAERREEAMAYMRLFQLDPNSQDVRRYIADRFKHTWRGAEFGPEAEKRFAWMRQEISDGLMAAFQSNAIAHAELSKAMAAYAGG